MGEVKLDYRDKEKIVKLFRTDEPVPAWWLAFLEKNGLRNARIADIQQFMHKEDGAFVVRVTNVGNRMEMGERYLEFKSEGAKHFFLLKHM